MAESRLEEFLSEISQDLDRCMEFWLKHSHDDLYGGFFDCLSEDGTVYDETKHVWLQARQVWMYARLYNEDDRFRRPEILSAAIKGADFLMRNVKDKTTMKCCLEITRDGKPIKIQRTIFSECFYMMAMSEVGRATAEDKYKKEAIDMIDTIAHWVREDDSIVRRGQPRLSGEVSSTSLAVPLMLMCLINQLETQDPELRKNYQSLAEWSVAEILKHIKRDGNFILENISPSGEELSGSRGRLLIPGHSIEAGWLLLEYAVKTEDEDLKKTAVEQFMVKPFNYGWDTKYGGLFYFLDVDGHSPVQLEWDMKLWWPHNEAMIAFLMAYKETNNVTMLEKFAQVFDYSYGKFVDKDKGEWYGYLGRNGQVSLKFKGGPWKGCFHVPRSLFMCEKLLREILKK